ncbi:MAG: cytochrome c [Xanthobacteraceae bacterium]|nr:cytochrome c [Xanthobacteraceae bacterium]
MSHIGNYAAWVALAVVLGGSGGAAFAGDAAKGKATFVRVGCYECHGHQGQGGIAGLKLAPDPLPYETLAAFVRSSSGPMPPYSDKILSDADLSDIYAYLASIPKPPDPKSIPALNP